MTDSPIFIVGCPRSGTSLLRDLLRSHSHLTFPSESHFIPPFYKGYGDPKGEVEAMKLSARILNLRYVQRWGLSLKPNIFAQDRTFREIISRIYGEWALKMNKTRWGDKTPHYVTSVPTLVELFPACKIIHIYRDGRDVALSWLRTKFEPQNIFDAALRWKYYVNAGLRDGARLPPETYREIRYEALISQPEDVMKSVCKFIGEPFEKAVLERDLLKLQGPVPLLPQQKNPLARNPQIVRTNLEKWKTEMSSSDRILFESLAGDLLNTLGYETKGVTRRVSKAEKILWRTHQRIWWALDRLSRRGHRWSLIRTALELKSATMRFRFPR